MGISRNKQVITFELCVILCSVMNVHTILPLSVQNPNHPLVSILYLLPAH